MKYFTLPPRRISRSVGCGRFALVCAALQLASCIPGLPDSDDCQWDDERCLGEHTKQHCYDSDSGGNHWSSTHCDAEHPYCVRVLDAWTSGRSAAECVSEPHCSASSECAYHGLCADGPGHCLLTAEGCANSERCKTAGFCASGEQECTATELGCSTSEGCTEHGECTLRDGQCRGTVDSCKNSTACRTSGACFWVPEETFYYDCEATAESCARSTNCAEHGECLLVDGYCRQG